MVIDHCVATITIIDVVGRRRRRKVVQEWMAGWQ
jgi:hypothetical protein